MKKLTLVLLISITFVFNGCTSDEGLSPQAKRDITELLNLKIKERPCKYPKLRIYKAPEPRYIPKGMSLQDAFVLQNTVNRQLRGIIIKYSKGNSYVNETYNKERNE